MRRPSTLVNLSLEAICLISWNQKWRGGWGEGTIADTSTHPPVVKKLEYKFDGWNGDDLLTSFPVFIVSERLSKGLESSNLSGYELAPVEITKSEEFGELFPNTVLPNFTWLKIIGTIGEDDFAINQELRLVVSELASKLLSMYKLTECEVDEC